MLSRLFHQIADENKPESGFQSAVQSILGSVAPLYGVGAMVNRLRHEYGIAERSSLPATVFSVGNITVGGTGKTPFVVWLTDWLRQQGKSPAVLTRGYGRDDEDRLVVVHNGKRLLAGTREAGDEPVLLARALGDVPVFACADRALAGKMALRKLDVDAFVLDDGFQHHRLARQADIVLIDATRPLSGLRLLPRGTLREPLGVLARAHLIVLTRIEQARQPERVLREIQRYAPAVPVVRCRTMLAEAIVIATGEKREIEDLKGCRVVLISAVGNPKAVRESMRLAGMKVVKHRALRDHAPITKLALEKAEELRVRAKADYVVMTEKDAVKAAEVGDLPETILSVRAKVEMLTDRDARTADRVLRARLHAKLVRGYLR